MLRTNLDIQLRPKDAARRLGIAPSTFWQWLKQDPNFPPVTRLGRTTSISAAALDEYVAKRTQAAVGMSASEAAA